MNQAADRYPRRVGRVLPGDLPVPLRAAGRRLRSLWTVPRLRTARTPDLRRPGPSGAQWGAWGAGTIDPSCDPTPCPSPPVHLSRPPSPRPPEREKFARALRAFCLPRCARQGDDGAGGPTTQGRKRSDERRAAGPPAGPGPGGAPARGRAGRRGAAGDPVGNFPTRSDRLRALPRR